MLFRKYGDSYQSVEPNFDSKALNEIGFRRNRSTSLPVDELASRYEPVATHELVAEAEGPVQDETEAELLAELERRLDEVVGALPPGGIVVVENEMGHDYPKTRQKISNVVVSGENRLRFRYSLEPALRVSVHRPRG